MTEQTPDDDLVFSRICETSTRLMAGVVTRPTMKALQKTVQDSAADYPWQPVVDRVLEDGVDKETLVKKALRSQRDWIVRGGRQTPGKGAKHAAKSCVARMLARLIFLLVLIPLIVALLVLLKHRWPEFDIYRILEWLRETWPTVFGK